jgi:hypothetical protein
MADPTVPRIRRYDADGNPLISSGAYHVDIKNTSVPVAPYGGFMAVRPDIAAAAAANAAKAAADTAVVVTLTADANNKHVVEGLVVGYSEAPTGGKLTIADGAATVFEIPIIAGGPVYLPITIEQAAKAANLVITLAAGGGTAVGYVNVLNHYTIAG